MPSPTTADTPRPRSLHATDHHAADPRPHVAALLELRSLGWYLSAIRPDLAAPALWRVAIQRYDGNASITVTEADPDEALDELIRYAAADAEGPGDPTAASDSAASDERRPTAGSLVTRPARTRSTFATSIG